MLRYCAVFVLLAGALSASKPKHDPNEPVTSGNDIVDVYATVITNKEAITKLLGMDPGLDLIVAQVKVAPKGDNKIRIDRDDFTLLSSKDGQRSQPLEPGQIAGRGSIVVSSVGVRGSGGAMGQTGGPVWGGIPGTGGVPMGGAGVGNTPNVTEAKTTVNEGSGEKENPLLTKLKEKLLPQQETNDSLSGLLYFLLDGKTPKMKDLSLIYKSPQGRVIVEFK